MKKLFYVLFTLIALNTFAQIGDPIQINAAGQVKFSGHDGFKVIGDDIYATYLQEGNIIFAFSENNGQNFTETEIDLSYASIYGVNNEPVLEVLSDGTIIIIYLTREDEGETTHYYLKKAVKTSTGNFEIEIIDDNILETPKITNSNDNITLFYKTGFSKKLSSYQLFTNTEESENADYSQESSAVRYWGSDVIDGPMHSNSDIWIQNGGGGNNDGWPTFNGFVSTTGIFRNFNQGGTPLTDAQKELIFYGEPFPGYMENAPEIGYGGAEDVRANGIWAFNGFDIAYIKMDGSSFTSRVANIEFVGVEEFEVYSWYPNDTGIANSVVNAGGNWFEDSDNVWTNHIAIYDTTWSEGPSGMFNDNSYFVDCELWIEGEVSGAVTFASSDTIFVVGDITYAGTVPGVGPDDEDNPNTTDYFGLISEEKILIKYKHRDPFEEMQLRQDNCNDINLYGSYAAIGSGNLELYGEQNCHYEGIFSFEYQHPHGSTPDYIAVSPYNGQDTLYTYIDFHKFIYPIYSFIPPNLNGFRLHSNNPDPGSGLVCGYPLEGFNFSDPNEYNASYPNNEPFEAFPYGTDYPWYNPVWPESSLDIVGERGTIHLWGSMAQTRRGYSHRSGMDPYNHGTSHSDTDRDCPECLYDPENFLFGGTHSSTGYEKNYHYDSRLEENSPPLFPFCTIGEQRIKVLRTADSGENFTEVYSEDIYPGVDVIGSTAKNENVIHYISGNYLGADFYELFSDDSGESYQVNEINEIFNPLEIESASISENHTFFHRKFSANYNYDWIYTSNFQSNGLDLAETFQLQDQAVYSDFNISNSDEKVMLWTFEQTGDEEPGFYYTSGNYYFDTFMAWEPDFLIENVNPIKTKINMKFNEDDVVYIMLHKIAEDNEEQGDLYLYTGSLDGITVNAGNDELQITNYELNVFPNPFNPSTTISFNISLKDVEESKIEIYNIKGQKVKSYSNEQIANSQNHQIVWDGKDEKDKSVSSGTYFFKLSDGKKEVIKKAVLIK